MIDSLVFTCLFVRNATEKTSDTRRFLFILDIKIQTKLTQIPTNIL